MSDDLQRELLAIFEVEAADRIVALNRALMRIEHAGAAERAGLLASIFRDAHSLKGAARAVGIEPVEHIAHALESAFARMQSGEAWPTPAGFDAVYRAVDAVAALVRRAAGADEEPPPVDAIRSALEDAFAAGAPDPAVDSEPSEAEDVPRAPAAPDHASGGGRGDAEFVRVSVARLDDLMAEIGELRSAVVGLDDVRRRVRAIAAEVATWESAWLRSRAALRRSGRASGTEAGSEALAGGAIGMDDEQRTRLAHVRSELDVARRMLEESYFRVSQTSGAIDDAVRRARTVPMSVVFEPLPRMARDLARALGREVRILTRGGDVTVDRSVTEELGAPLQHLVRNAIDHGVEPTGERLAAGKPREATITLTAMREGEWLAVEVSDDGRGVDLESVRAAAVRSGFIDFDEASGLGETETLDLLFRPGLSTAASVTNVSGRGVGLDVVRDTVVRLQGTVEARTRSGSGTTFVLRVPPSLAITRCLLASAGGRVVAFPTAAVERILRVRSDSVVSVEGRDAVVVGERPVPLASLADALGERSAGERQGGRESAPVVVLRAGERAAALALDDVLDVRDLVVKPLPSPLYRVAGIGGAAILPAGRPVAVLAAADLVRRVEGAGDAPRPFAPADSSRRRVLLVEDSPTTRALERNILAGAGYEVVVAADGREAWEILRSESFDCIVTDVEMPRMDGLELTRRVRADPRIADVPVVVVTSLDAADERERGMLAGADAYLGKATFDQASLLETIRRLV